ncbi:sigma-54-dependent Fis family transcriptional regulator [candidate division KSB1 bacterium]|nr:sigma-54-dependent Fis family transcriptional regulator [candidate division KSB1 bacterium]
MHRLLFSNIAAHHVARWTECLERQGHVTCIVNSLDATLQSIHDFLPSMIFIGGCAQNDALFETIEKIKMENAALPLIVLSQDSHIDFVIKSIKCGAFEFFEIPSDDKKFLALFQKLTKYLNAPAEPDVSKKSLEEPPHIIGISEASQKVACRILKIAPLEVDVMISGETGTGKELVARSIHKLSERAHEPFIAIDCVSLPPNLIESEIFGYERGAFTGATKTKQGLLELAHGGTVFLDEITELDIYLQSKLLRVLQERKFRRIGASKLIDIDARIISATNLKPEDAVAQNKLRKDLYYRLNVVPIELLPLRERKSDIAFLVEHFIEEMNKSSKIVVKGITRKAMNLLINYDWPGNVREVQNVILQTISLLESEMIDVTDLPSCVQRQKNDIDPIVLLKHPEPKNYKEARALCLRQFCQDYFQDILKKYQGNITEVAREADLSRGTIYKIFKECDIDNPYVSK